MYGNFSVAQRSHGIAVFASVLVAQILIPGRAAADVLQILECIHSRL